MYQILKNLYVSGRMSDEQLAAAIVKGWITETERNEIIASKDN